jgi:hypothetical protein
MASCSPGAGAGPSRALHSDPKRRSHSLEGELGTNLKREDSKRTPGWCPPAEPDLPPRAGPAEPASPRAVEPEPEPAPRRAGPADPAPPPVAKPERPPAPPAPPRAAEPERSYSDDLSGIRQDAVNFVGSASNELEFDKMTRGIYSVEFFLR